jgi:iron(III) transport system permease protein
MATGVQALPAPLERVGRRWGSAAGWATWGLVAVLGLLVLYPLLNLMAQPVRNLPALWREAAGSPRLGEIMIRTVVLAFGSSLLATLAATVLAWCRAGLGGRAGAVAQVVTLVPLAIPPIAGVTGWAFLLSPNVGYLNQLLRLLPGLDGLDEGPFDVYSLSWIVIITGIYLIPFAFIFINSGLSNIDPRLEDAARAAGSGWCGTQLRVVLPLLRPAIIYGSGVVALLALGQFAAPLLLGRTKGIDVITTQLYRLTATSPPNYPLATFIAVPLLFLGFAGVAGQRRLLRHTGRFRMAAKGAARARSRHPWLIIPVVVYAFTLVVPPLLGLGLVALSPYWGGPLAPGDFSLDAFRELLQTDITWQAIINSLEYSIIATLLCLVLSVGLALVALRTHGPAARIVDYLVNLPIAVPAILFGMAMFLTFALGPASRMLHAVFGWQLYGSGAVLILAYVVLVLPHGTRLAMSGIAQINPQLEQAALVFGSGPVGAVWHVLLPLLRRHLVGAAMLMFILCSQEFAASALLVGPDSQVMSTVLYGQWDTGTYPRVAALALAMVLIAIIGLAGIILFDREDIA